MKNKKFKLCYILELYDKDTSLNVVNQYRFVEKVSSMVDMFLIFEAGRGKIEISNARRIYVQKFNRKPWSQIEQFIVLLSAWLLGYRCFYSYFSRRSALLSKLITSILSGRTYYFECSELKKKDVKGSFFRRWSLFMALRYTDYFITPGPRMAKFYIDEYGVDPKRIKLMPHWLDVERFQGHSKKDARERLGLDENKIVVLFVHQLNRSKGAHYIPEIVNYVVGKIPEAFFLVVGGPGLGDDVSQLLYNSILKYGLGNLIRMEGAIPNKDIEVYYAASDIYIMPSKTEGFPVVLLEAMASGLPFVATDGGGPLRDLLSLKQQEHILPVGEIEIFSQKIVELLSDEKETKALIKDGLSHVNKYSIDGLVKVFLKEIIN